MLPVLFKIGSFEVRSYGVMMLIAFLVGLWVVRRRSKLYGFDYSQIGDVTFWALIAGVLGARIVFIAQEWSYYSAHPKELYTLQFAGLTSFGGLIFGFLAVLIWAWRKKANLIRLMDLLAPGFLIGHVIGRVGCLLNGCCFGDACPPNLPWGIHVEGSTVLHHPAQIYDSLMNLAAFGLLLFAERKNLRSGQLVALFFMLHGAARFVYEFWRAGTDAQVAAGEASSTYWGNLGITQAQAMAAAIVLAGAVMWAVCARRGARTAITADDSATLQETQPA